MLDIALELHNLAPEPQEEWRRMLRFAGWNRDEANAAARSVEVLFRRGTELVVATYDYLRQTPETAAILGWETGVDEGHLEERRRFFTVWLARTLGLDTSDEFALYLFRAGQYHAGHGPRRIHTPSGYVTASLGLVQNAFARYMLEAGLPTAVAAPALGAWSKYLAVQGHQMMLGYRSGRALDSGPMAVPCSVFGRLRPILGTSELVVHAAPGDNVGGVLTKLFDYSPQFRAEVLERRWEADEKNESLWTEVHPTYVPRSGWRVLHNGRDVRYAGGFGVAIQPGDTLALFPPGR